MLIFSELELFGRRLSLSHGVNIVQYLSNLTKQGHFLQFPAICLDAIRSGQGLCCSSLHLNEGRSEWGWGQRVFEDTGTDSGSVTGAERSGSGTAKDGRQTDHSRTATAKRQKIRPAPRRSHPPIELQVGFRSRAVVRTLHITQTLKTPTVKNCTFAL